MRASLPLLLALSELLSNAAALRHETVESQEHSRLLREATPAEDLESRAAPTDKPRYSMVPLFPDEDDDDESGNGSNPGDDNDGGDNGNGDDGNGDGDSVVTLIRTVTDDPVTKILTRTVPSESDVDTKTVTKALPTTKTVVSVIDMDDDVTTTVYVTQTPAPLPPTPEPTTSTSSANTNPTSPTWRPTITLPELTTATQPTTFVTLTKSSSSSTYNNGQWPATRSYDNGQWHTIYPPWNATDSSRWRRRR